MKLSRKQTNSCTNRSNCEKISIKKKTRIFSISAKGTYGLRPLRSDMVKTILSFFLGGGRILRFGVSAFVSSSSKRENLLLTLRNFTFYKKSKPSAGRFRPLGGGVTAGSSWLLPVSLLLTFCSNWISFRLYSLSKLPCSAIFLPYSTSYKILVI